MTTERRTAVSKWMYRIAIAFFITVTLRYTQLQWEAVNYSLASIPDQFSEIPIIAGSMLLPFTMALATIALLLRSSASLWLSGLVWLNLATKIALPFFTTPVISSPVAALMAIVVLVMAVILAALLFFLVKRDEVRAL